MRAYHGAGAAWGDTERLLADQVDVLAHLHWSVGLIGQAWGIFKNIPKRPPKPIRRPTDDVAADAGAAVPEGRKMFRGGSFSPEELDRIIERQTGAPHGIAPEEG